MVSSGTVEELSLPAERQVVQVVRDRFEAFARPLRLTTDEAEALKVALSEAFSNAVCHGSPHGPHNQVHVRFETRADRLIVEVTDEGQGFEPAEIALPGEEEWKPSGRGLFLMEALTDGVEFEARSVGTCVRITKLLLWTVAETHGTESRAASRGEVSFSGSFAVAGARV